MPSARRRARGGGGVTPAGHDGGVGGCSVENSPGRGGPCCRARRLAGVRAALCRRAVLDLDVVVVVLAVLADLGARLLARDTDRVVVPGALHRVGEHLPRVADPSFLGARRGDLGSLGTLRGLGVGDFGLCLGEPISVRVADLVLRRVGVDTKRVVVALGLVVVAHSGTRSPRKATSSSMATRSWFIVSRSRTVTAWSSRVSKSMVTHHGVPTSSCRR